MVKGEFMIKYQCTSPINANACHIYKDQRCCIGCRHKKDDDCRCSEIKCKCKYKIITKY